MTSTFTSGVSRQACGDTPIYDTLWLKNACWTWDLPPQLSIDVMEPITDLINSLLSAVLW